MTEELILAEYLRRKSERKPKAIDWAGLSFGQQAQVIENDTDRMMAILCTRRAGKSYGVGLKLIRTALMYPGSNSLYAALTRDSARRIMWKDVLKTIVQRLGIKAEPNKVELSLTFPNGSVISLMGLDASENEQEKVLGQKFKLAVIDEAASFRQDLRNIIFSKIRPALADDRGQLIMLGTPGDLTRGVFYEATRTDDLLKREKGWKVYEWSALDNPFMRDQWLEDIELLKANNPRIEETPFFIQMYLGKWFVDESKRVYKFASDINLIDEAPEANWSYVMGIDLGYSPDPSAISIVAYRAHDPKLYILETWKQTEMDLTDLAGVLKSFSVKYPNARMVVDAANKQAVEEMKNRHGLPLISAEKHGKAGYISLMNADFQKGIIKLVDGGTHDLQTEYAELIWDGEDKKLEHPACPNHLADATLYAWRYAYNYAATARTPPPPEPTSQAAVEKWEEIEEAKAAGKLKKPWDLDFEEKW